METALEAALTRTRYVRVHFPERDDAPVSRVEEVADPLLVLRAPSDRFGRVIMPAVGERLVLSWDSRSGITTLPATVVGTLSQPSPRWRLRTEDKPVSAERRTFIRLMAELPLAVRGKRPAGRGHRCATSARAACAAGSPPTHPWKPATKSRSPWNSTGQP